MALLAALLVPVGGAGARPPEPGAEPPVVDVVAASGLAGSHETWSASAVDYDRDGRQDVWIGRHDQGGRLYRGDGTGHYVRVARGAWPAVTPTGQVPDRHACAWADVDRDGLVDAYCATGRGGGNGVKHGRANELWLQGPPGTFTDRAAAWGVGELCGRSQYVAFLHADGDRYPDLFVGNSAPRVDADDPCDDPTSGLPDEDSRLYLNARGTALVPTTAFRGLNVGGRCLEVVDVDRDGRADLFTCQSGGARLWRNEGSGRFRDATAALGLGRADYRDVAFGDLDGDGDEDLAAVTAGAVLVRTRTPLGFDGPVPQAAVTAGQGLALGDADGDGATDLVVVTGDVARRSNPADVLLLGDGSGGSRPVAVPGAGGTGGDVLALHGDPDGRTEFLVLNGEEDATGPVQLLEVR